MKIKVTFVLILLVFCTGIFAQVPQTINYQGMLRDNAGVPVSSLSTIGVQFQISDGSNTIVHNETQGSVPISQLGLFSTKIGGTTAISNTINWANGPFTLSVSVDAGGGFIFIGSQQLASVPFALFAQNTNPQTLSVNGNSLSISNGNTVALPGSISYTSGTGISITGSVIANTAPDQTVTIANGVNVNVGGTYPNFTVDATPSLAVLGNQLSITGGNSVTLPTGTTYTNGTGIAFINGTVITNSAPDQTVNITGPGVSGSYPNFTVSSSPATTITPGNTNITVNGISPNYTISSTPTLALNAGTLSISNGNSVVFPPVPPATSITGAGASNVTGGPNFTVNTPITAITGSGGVTVLSAFPNFTISAPAAITPTINGAGIATVTPLTGNNFTVNVATPTLVGTGATSVSGTYPTFTVNTPTLSPGWTIFGNAGTSPTVNFIGTTDNNALVFKTNSQRSGRIDPVGPTFFGYQSGNVNTNPNATGFGYQSLLSNTTGSENVAVGTQALYSNTSGNWNTATGYRAMYTNSTGISNTANGWDALYFNNGDYNTATGAWAVYSNSTGYDNTALGFKSLYANTTGYGNTAAGKNSLAANTTGYYNSALGSGALFSNSTGSLNTAIGYEAMKNHTTGFANTGLGYQALYWTNGNLNTGVGYGVLQNNTTGINNTAIGATAGYLNNGSGNVFIGYTAGYNASGSNQLWIANSNVGNPLIYGDFTAGSIGLGTLSPQARLHVADANAKVMVDATAGGVSVSQIEMKTATAGSALFTKYSSSGRLTIESGGAYNMRFLNSIGGSYQFDEGVNTRLYIAAGGNVGINTTGPTANLHVAGTTRLQDASAGVDKILRSDASGNATWVNSSINSGFAAYSTANQSVAPSSWSQIAYSTEDFDDGNSFASNQFVCPTAGVYQFDASVSWAPFAISGTWTHIAIWKNGVIYKIKMETATTGYFSNNISAAMKCSAGDVITVRVFHQSSGNENIYGTSSGYTYFTGFRVY